MIAASLQDLVSRAAQKYPDRLALTDGDRSMTYAELLTAAAGLCRELESVNVGAESVVALDLAPSPRTVVAMIGAGLRGAAFQPIDPREPASRRAVMQQLARPTAIVTADAVTATPDGVRLDEQLPARAGLAAYVSFTSGSTGKPKAVVTEQQAIVNYIEQVVRMYGLTPADRQLQFSSIAFDIAIDEIFSTLAAGATVVHRGNDFTFGGVEEFLDQCRARAITVLNLPTGLWNRFGAELATKPDIRLPVALRLVVVGGEAAYPSAVSAWHAASVHPDFRLVNAYGPTEAAVSVTFAPLMPGLPVTLGRPLGGVAVTLLDEDDHPVPAGEAGEIVLGGIAPARGYLQQAGGGFGEIDGEWSYRTGDLARRSISGELQFLGRVDSQVKVRGGFRVEPGEVAAVLQAHPEVQQAHVQPHERRGAKVLAAFVVPTGSRHIDLVSLRATVSAALPDWMVPWHIQVVHAVPLTARGKVDESTLASLLPNDDPTEAEDARFVIVAAWETAVGVRPETDDESFFEAGGDSLAALELIEILRARFGRAPSMSDFYRAPTVGDLVAGLTQADDVEQNIPTAHHTTGRTLVRMRRAGTGRLWCFLPPLSGAVTRYAAMAALLPATEAVWAMETPVALSDAGMDKLADGLADRLLAEDLGAFDSIVFSGYSLGGVFAHEVARRVAPALTAAGSPHVTVAALLLDPPDPTEPPMSLDEAFEIFVKVGWRISEPASTFVTADGYDLSAVAAAARRAGSLASAGPDREVSDAWAVYASNARVLDGHVLSEGVRHTYLLQCREDSDVPAGRWRRGEHSGSWAKVLPPGHTSIIALEHFALMQAPNDRAVLGWLTETITEAVTS